MSKEKRKISNHPTCVGCQARIAKADAIFVTGLGVVCKLCNEVVDIVFEVEIERTREAVAKLEAFIADLKAGG